MSLHKSISQDEMSETWNGCYESAAESQIVARIVGGTHATLM
jgi:hypothetical protein